MQDYTSVLLATAAANVSLKRRAPAAEVTNQKAPPLRESAAERERERPGRSLLVFFGRSATRQGYFGICGAWGWFGGAELGVGHHLARWWHPAIEMGKINFLRTSLPNYKGGCANLTLFPSSWGFLDLFLSLDAKNGFQCDLLWLRA